MVAVVKHVSINDKANDVVVDITDECSFRRMDSAEDSSYVNSLDSMAPTQRLRDMIDEFSPSNSASFLRGFLVKGTSFQDCADGHAFLINAALGLDISAEEKLRFIFDTLDPDRTGSILLGQVEKLLESSFPIAKLEYKDLDTKSIASLLFRKAKAHNKYMTYTQFRCAFLEYVTDSYGPSNPHHVNASGNCGNLHGGIDGKTFLIDGDQELDTSAEAKLRSIFDMIDTNRTGSISLDQVQKLLETNFSNAKLQIVGMDVKGVAALLFHEAKARDGSMNFTQFRDVFQGYVAGSYRLNKQPTDLELSFNSTSRHALSPRPSNFAKWYDKNKVRIWWLVIYVVANNVAFWLKWFSYKVDPALGYGLRIARACAQVAMLNVLLLFMPMLRSITQVMKRSRLLWRYIPFDDHIEAHKICGSVCLIAGIIHTLAHVSNEIHLYLIATPDEISRSVFAMRKVKAFENGLPPFSVMLQAIPVWTGIVLIVITAISFPLAAFPKLRGGNFNVFWYSHMLFGVFLIFFSFHGATSWLAHASAHWWVGPPFALYLIERRYRYAKTFAAPVRILEAVELEQTCAVFMEKPRRFMYRPGMYLFINCPTISTHEWHPFTISSAPDDNYVSIHMKNAGDWTGAFHKLIADCHANKTLYPEVYLDGPVGAPTQDYHRYSTVICVGGGIGIMPFASILKDVVHSWVKHSCTNCQHVRHPSSFKIQKLYFHWTTREQESLGWFTKTLNQITAMDRDNIIEAHQYLTSVKDSDNTSQLKMFQQFVHDQTGRDFVSGLETKILTHFGRPNWDQVFQDARRAHAGEKVGVFFCGPHPLEKVLDEMCKKYSDPTPGGTVFDYHSEKFG